MKDSIFIPIKEFIPHLYYKGKINNFFYNLCLIDKNDVYILDILQEKNLEINLRNIKFIKLLKTFDYNPPNNYTINHIFDEYGGILNKNYFQKCFFPKHNKKIYFIKY